MTRWGQINITEDIAANFGFNRNPIATVGVVGSEANTNFYGRNGVSLLVDLRTRGISQAIVRARIPNIPVNADQIDINLYAGERKF